MKIEGVWLPIITPFQNDELDLESYERLIDYYCQTGITGIIANGTTGESPVLSESEFELLAKKTVEYTRNRLPVYFGVGGNYTREVVHKMKIAEQAGVEGFLSVSPYYNRPDQRGIYEHFKQLAGSTSLPIILYNIPYRTGRNMENSTVLRLSEISNIVGIKDASGNINQTLELIHQKPAHFSVLTGEDAFYFTSLANGSDGGILASAHVHTEKFINIWNAMRNNDYKAALPVWNQLFSIIPLLFKEPNPAPLKYILARMNLIRSGELRLPLVEISDSLKQEIDLALGFESAQALSASLLASEVI